MRTGMGMLCNRQSKLACHAVCSKTTPRALPHTQTETLLPHQLHRLLRSTRRGMKWNEICRAHTNFKYQRATTFFVVASTHTRCAHLPLTHFTTLFPWRTLPIDASQSYAAVVIVPALPPPLRRSTLHNEATWGPRHAPGSQGNKLLPRSHASAPRTFSLSN